MPELFLFFFLFFLDLLAVFTLNSLSFLLQNSITGLGTKAQNLAQRPEESTTSLTVLETPELSLEQAHLVLEKAKAKAIELGTKIDIALVDAGGNLKAFVRMDGACLGCIDIAIRKARTARWFDRPTGEPTVYTQVQVNYLKEDRKPLRKDGEPNARFTQNNSKVKHLETPDWLKGGSII